MVAGRSIRIGVGLTPHRGSPLVLPITWSTTPGLNSCTNLQFSSGNLAMAQITNIGQCAARATASTQAAQFQFELTVSAQSGAFYVGD
jgi:hypothetical protein